MLYGKVSPYTPPLWHSTTAVTRGIVHGAGTIGQKSRPSGDAGITQAEGSLRKRATPSQAAHTPSSSVRAHAVYPSGWVRRFVVSKTDVRYPASAMFLSSDIKEELAVGRLWICTF